MEVKINCRQLSEQLQLLDMYSSVMNNKYNKNLVDGIIDLLDKICWAVEEEEKIDFVRVD